MSQPMQIILFTLFPGIFPGPLGVSLIGKALAAGKWELDIVNLRDFAIDRHRTIDDSTFGGGPGMILRADVIDKALKSKFSYNNQHNKLIYLSPRGHILRQAMVKSYTKISRIGLICGRFEGIDQRVIEHWFIDEVSVGDYILAGGEVAAMVLIESCIRLLPGVLGAPESLNEESFSQGLLEYPQYTRPRCWESHEVPSILFSGHHSKINKWRLSKSEELTKKRRPDLWQHYVQLNKNQSIEG